MAKEYSDAETVAQIANGLIPNHHPELAGARMRYVHVSKVGMKNGRELWGKARKVSGLWEWALELDFVIEVALDKWNEMESSQRTALVDHLLECCTGEEDEKSGEMKWSIREPEIQEFTTVLERHGVWNAGLLSFVQVAHQINLDHLIEEEAEVDLSEELLNEEADA